MGVLGDIKGASANVVSLTINVGALQDGALDKDLTCVHFLLLSGVLPMERFVRGSAEQQMATK